MQGNEATTDLRDSSLSAPVAAPAWNGEQVILDFGSNHHLVYRSDGLSSPEVNMAVGVASPPLAGRNVRNMESGDTADRSLDFAILETSVSPSAGCLRDEIWTKDV